MGIVVEVISRSGTVVSTDVFDGNSVAVGRGFACQVVIHDPHIDAVHLKVQRDPVTGALVCDDQHTLNGTWAVRLNKKDAVHRRLRQIQQRMPFYSGQAFQLGKSYIRVYDTQHHLPATLPLSPWEETAHKLDHAWLWASLAFTLLVLQVWDSYINLPLAENLSQYVLRAFYVLLGAFVYAGVFSFLGKNFKHDPKLSSHFTVGVACVLAVYVINYLSPYFAYWFNVIALPGVVRQLLIMVVIFAAVYISLALATPLKRGARSVTASVAPVALLLSVLINWLATPQFQAYPPYDKNLIQPAWQFKDAGSVDKFLDRADEVYDTSVWDARPEEP